MESRKYVFEIPVVLRPGQEIIIYGWCKGKKYIYGVIGPFPMAAIMEGIVWDELSCCEKEEVLLQAQFLDYDTLKQ